MKIAKTQKLYELVRIAGESADLEEFYAKLNKQNDKDSKLI